MTTYIDKQTALMMMSQEKVNHILHLILSILTVGSWVIIWLLVSASSISVRNQIAKDAGLPLEANVAAFLIIAPIVIIVLAVVFK